jgi:hypothetical protein
MDRRFAGERERGRERITDEEASMTANELRERMSRMSREERIAFMKGVGFPTDWDDGRVMECFIKENTWEKAICHQLGVPTEADKVGEANIRSAQYAVKGYVLGWIGIGIAVISLVVAIVALMK